MCYRYVVFNMKIFKVLCSVNCFVLLTLAVYFNFLTLKNGLPDSDHIVFDLMMASSIILLLCIVTTIKLISSNPNLSVSHKAVWPFIVLFFSVFLIPIYLWGVHKTKKVSG